MNELERRIIDISYKKKLSHIGSCLNSVGTIAKVYSIMKPGDTFVLGNSHAALALYVVLEKMGYGNAEDLFDKHGTHACRDEKAGISVSGGSLGQAETVALGMALVDSDHTVYIVTSDGACSEGSLWEVLRVAHDFKVKNLKITVIANGYGGLGKINVDDLEKRLNAFFPVSVLRINLSNFPKWIQGLNGHYAVMDDAQYQEILS